MERKVMELYCAYEELIHKDIQGLSLQELFDLKYDILRLRKVIMDKLNEIELVNKSLKGE